MEFPWGAPSAQEDGRSSADWDMPTAATAGSHRGSRDADEEATPLSRHARGVGGRGSRDSLAKFTQELLDLRGRDNGFLKLAVTRHRKLTHPGLVKSVHSGLWIARIGPPAPVSSGSGLHADLASGRVIPARRLTLR